MPVLGWHIDSSLQALRVDSRYLLATPTRIHSHEIADCSWGLIYKKDRKSCFLFYLPSTFTNTPAGARIESINLTVGKQEKTPLRGDKVTVTRQDCWGEDRRGDGVDLGMEETLVEDTGNRNLIWSIELTNNPKREMGKGWPKAVYHPISVCSLFLSLSLSPF